MRPGELENRSKWGGNKAAETRRSTLGALVRPGVVPAEAAFPDGGDSGPTQDSRAQDSRATKAEAALAEGCRGGAGSQSPSLSGVAICPVGRNVALRRRLHGNRTIFGGGCSRERRALPVLPRPSLQVPAGRQGRLGPPLSHAACSPSLSSLRSALRSRLARGWEGLCPLLSRVLGQRLQAGLPRPAEFPPGQALCGASPGWGPSHKGLGGQGGTDGAGHSQSGAGTASQPGRFCGS